MDTQTTPTAPLTIAETARRLNVHRQTVISLIERGELRAVKVGQQWRVSAASVDELLAPLEA
jgi:excisionase family DNA binding protein